MKLSDYIARFLAKRKIRHVFAVTGGASVHLIDSIARTPGITYVCPQHEQAGAMAADAYARVTKNLGAAVTTSGPGATNLLTGVCCAYYDSVPVIFITGQVSTFRLKKNTGVRQIGFQETDVIDIFKPVTKYAVLVKDPKKIKYELEKACFIARSGRPGPTLLDIPDNVQRMDVNPEKLRAFKPKPVKTNKAKLNKEIDCCLKLIRKAKRPVLILGWGVRLANAERTVLKLVEKLGFPVAPTWAAADIIPANDPLLIGTFGTHGTRYANFAVQNADLVISIGSRLDTKATGSPIATFAREAKKVIVDIDACELGKFRKFGLKVDLLVNADADDFAIALLKKLKKVELKDISAWFSRISKWKKKYPVCPAVYYKEKDVNPYVFVKTLSEISKEGDVIVSDTGCALAWLMQAFDFKKHQRIFHDWNNTAMGWALPAAIGVLIALKNRPVICVTGDGSLQMNLQELATVMRHCLPIKIFLINNHGYSMIQQTQAQWLSSRYLASTVKGGLAFPDFEKLAKTYGFKTVTISKNKELMRKIRKVMSFKGPVFCNVEIRPDRRVIPQVKFGRPNEDAEPLLERKEFFQNMIVKPISEK